MDIRLSLKYVIITRVIIQLFNIYGLSLLFCVGSTVCDPWLNLLFNCKMSLWNRGVRSIQRGGGSSIGPEGGGGGGSGSCITITYSHLAYGSLLVFCCCCFLGSTRYGNGGPNGFPGTWNVLALLVWPSMQCIHAMYLTSPATTTPTSGSNSSDCSGSPLTIPTLLRLSLQAAVCMTWISSILPLATIPTTGLLFSLTPCMIHVCISFLSSWLWVLTALFVQYRFQLSVHSRRNGLWVPVSITGLQQQEEGGDGGHGDMGRVAAVWKPEHVYTKGDVVSSCTVRQRSDNNQNKSDARTGAIVTTAAPEFQLESYCSISGQSQNVSTILTSPTTTGGILQALSLSPFLKSFASISTVSASWERFVFDVLASEVGPLASSWCVDSALLISSIGSAALAAAIYMSHQDALGILAFAVTELIMCLHTLTSLNSISPSSNIGVTNIRLI